MKKAYFYAVFTLSTLLVFPLLPVQAQIEQVAPVPEPSTLLLIGAGAVAAIFGRKLFKGK